MTDSIARRGWNRDRNARIRHRQQPRARAATLLTAYLDGVTAALATHGWQVEHRALTSTHPNPGPNPSLDHDHSRVRGRTR